MSRKFQRKGVAVAALLLALLAATPAHASGLSNWLDVPVFHSAWQWLANLLPGGVEVRPRGTTKNPAGAFREKSGAGSDPNGVALNSACLGGNCDMHGGVDPNG